MRGALQSSENPFESSTSKSPHHPKQGSNSVKTSKNSATPTPGQNPHFVWSLILENYFPTSNTENKAVVKDGDQASFADFWKVCVDGTFLFLFLL